MFKKILVALDLSEKGSEVFTVALSLASQYEAELMLLHVLSPEEDNSPLSVPENFRELYPAQGNDSTVETWLQEWQEFEQVGIDCLENYAQQGKNIKLDYKQISGNPAHTLCQIAQEWQAELIVMGRRGYSGLQEILLGSVSNYVLHHAGCSVLVIQHKSTHDHES